MRARERNGLEIGPVSMLAQSFMLFVGGLPKAKVPDADARVWVEPRTALATALHGVGLSVTIATSGLHANRIGTIEVPSPRETCIRLVPTV